MGTDLTVVCKYSDSNELSSLWGDPGNRGDCLSGHVISLITLRDWQHVQHGIWY